MKTQYTYDLDVLEKTVDQAVNASDKFDINLHYAMKANNNDKILNIISKQINVDCVSKEEIRKAKEYWKDNQIVFAGSGKTKDEINYALGCNIKTLHIESVDEFLYAKNIKEKISSKTKLALRVTLNINANTHRKISTGEKHHKFGLTDIEVFNLINKYPKDIEGIHCHIGSQILDTNWFFNYANTVKTFLNKLPKTFELNYLNLGGGLGIDYDKPNSMPRFKEWMQNIRRVIPKTMIKEIHLEPGRSIVGQCGKINAQVQWKKQRNNIEYLILDVGMSDILRPALYDAKHLITSINTKNKEQKDYVVFGPSCESSDIFGKYKLHSLNEEDYVEIHSTGAYVESMRLNYNLRTLLSSKYL